MWALFFCERPVLKYTAWFEQLVLNLLWLKSLLFPPHGFNCNCSSFFCFWSKISARSCHEGKTVSDLQISTIYWSAMSGAPCAGSYFTAMWCFPSSSAPSSAYTLRLPYLQVPKSLLDKVVFRWGWALETSCLHQYRARKAAYYSYYLC